jgi:predicted DNA-binding transcriptional regulator AlpA
MRKLLTTTEVADVLRRPVGTLRYWRHTGEGPRSVKIGRAVMYDADEVAAWIERHFTEQASVSG